MTSNPVAVTHAVRGNLAKALRVWSRISRILRGENASARLYGIFYKSNVQSILLFGSKAWVLALATLKRLEGFHVKAARRMTGLLPKMTGGSGSTQRQRQYWRRPACTL